MLSLVSSIVYFTLVALMNSIFLFSALYPFSNIHFVPMRALGIRVKDVDAIFCSALIDRDAMTDINIKKNFFIWASN